MAQGERRGGGDLVLRKARRTFRGFRVEDRQTDRPTKWPIEALRQSLKTIHKVFTKYFSHFLCLKTFFYYLCRKSHLYYLLPRYILILVIPAPWSDWWSGTFGRTAPSIEHCRAHVKFVDKLILIFMNHGGHVKMHPTARSPEKYYAFHGTQQLLVYTNDRHVSWSTRTTG